VIRRSPSPTRNYTSLHNSVLADSRLSWEARGLLAYLLSKPDHWKVHPKQLVNESPRAGRDKIYRLLHELQEAGYVAVEQTRTEGGKLGETDYVIYDLPQDDGLFTVYAFAVSGSAVSGKSGSIVNTDSKQTLKRVKTDSFALSENSETASAEKPKKARTTYSPEWEEIWAAYPRRISKAPGAKAYAARRREGISHESLLEATENYALARRRQDPQFTMHPGTFFGTARRFEEYLPGSTAYSEREASHSHMPTDFAGIAEFLEGDDEE